MPPLTTFSLGRFTAEKAERIKARLPKTYMNFTVVVVPYEGEMEVSVETYYEASREEILEHLLFALATTL